MDKIWLQHYPEHVSAEIDADAYTSIVDLFHQSIQHYGQQVAYSNLGKTISYQELDKLSRQFAAFLVQFGLKKGDRIAIMMPNLLQYPIALFGAFRAGLIVVNTNPLYTQRELEHQLNDSGAKAIIILENFAHTLDKVIAKTPVETVITTQLGDLLGFPKSLIANFVVKYIKKMVPAFHLPQAIPFKKALALGKEQRDFQDIPLVSNDIAFLQYTGGTTGVAKGAALTHRNMLANLLQAETWTAKTLESGKEIFITALPLYHVFSLTANALFALKIGAKNILITNPRDIPAFIKTLKEEPFSYVTGVNTLFNALLHNKDFSSVDFSHLKIALGGGMAVQKSVAERWQEVTGVILLEAYGLTETSPAVCINPMDLARYNGMIGLPIPSTEVSIRNEEGEEVSLNESGELWVRGPQVMQGYWQRSDETDKVLNDEGWLRTGDIAQINEQGYVKIVDRLKDMILVSGFNVYPNEIEDVVATHEKVLEVGAIGIPHEKSGEVVKIFVVKKDDSLTEDELKAHCRATLAGYKCPKAIGFVDSLPKSNVGKILRRELRTLKS